MPRTAIDYLKTIIYKIVCNDLNVKDVYVGGTSNFSGVIPYIRKTCL